MLAQARAEEIVSHLPTATADQTTLVAVGPGFTSFRWAWSTTTSTVGAQAPAGFTFADAAREVRVRVEIACAERSIDDRNAGSANDGRGEVAITRLWVE